MSQPERPGRQHRESRGLAFVHALTRLPGAYGLQQRLGYPTTSRFRRLLARHVRLTPDERVLDAACGIGTYREVLGGDYYGVDLNPAYVEAAQRLHSGTFEVMDCSRLTFAPETFDHVVNIAATHHLDDAQVDATVSGALRVCRAGGSLHVLDSVLPETGLQAFKSFWFRMDAGRFPRTRDALRARLARHGSVVVEDFLPGPLHDCAYFQVMRHEHHVEPK